MYLFMIVAPILWIGLHWYADYRLVRQSAWSPNAKRWLRLVIVLCALLPVVAMLSGRALGMDSEWARALQLAGFTLMGFSSVTVTLLLMIDLIRAATALFEMFHARWMRGAPAAPVDPSRRGFFGQLANLGVVGTATGVAGFGFAQVRSTPSVVEVEVPITNLPHAFEGFRIAQMTDIHVGPTIRGEYLRRCVDVCNGLAADMIAVTGDLIDGFVDRLAADVAPLGDLSAPEGVYFVTGNHEYYWDGPAWCAEVTRLGLRVLNNEHVVIERGDAKLLLAGCTDISAGQMVPGHRSDPAGARAGAPACDVSVLLAHQPRSIDAAAKAGYHLQISGHTHGGQYFPMNLLVYLAQPYVKGLAKHDDTTWIYVSRGTGYWGPPTRVGAPAEITLLKLVRAV
ncbi:MAG TPA: metallophosphoesterase [Nannocystaceae bacterium]|nr:metallophosphoesterase [Nannocystaceae bacterium]